MKARINLTFIVIASIFLLGCSNFTTLTEKEAIYEVFKEYDGEKKTGLVEVFEEDEYINIYYIARSKSFDKIIDLSKKADLTEEEKNTIEKLGISSMEEVSKGVLDKVEKLYKNHKVENITINVGVIENEKIGGISPGENVTKEPISYIQFFEFTRDKVESIDLNSLDKENYYKEL